MNKKYKQIVNDGIEMMHRRSMDTSLDYKERKAAADDARRAIGDIESINKEKVTTVAKAVEAGAGVVTAAAGLGTMVAKFAEIGKDVVERQKDRDMQMALTKVIVFFEEHGIASTAAAREVFRQAMNWLGRR